MLYDHHHYEYWGSPAQIREEPVKTAKNGTSSNSVWSELWISQRRQILLLQQ